MLWIDPTLQCHLTHVTKPVQPSTAKGQGTEILVNDTKHILGAFGAVGHDKEEKFRSQGWIFP